AFRTWGKRESLLPGAQGDLQAPPTDLLSFRKKEDKGKSAPATRRRRAWRPSRSSSTQGLRRGSRPVTTAEAGARSAGIRKDSRRSQQRACRSSAHASAHHRDTIETHGRAEPAYSR